MYILWYSRRNDCLQSDNSINNGVEMQGSSILIIRLVIGSIACAIIDWNDCKVSLLLIQDGYGERCSLWGDHSYLFILWLCDRSSRGRWEGEKAMWLARGIYEGWFLGIWGRGTRFMSEIRVFLGEGLLGWRRLCWRWIWRKIWKIQVLWRSKACFFAGLIEEACF